jgi:hypothetical protein
LIRRALNDLHEQENILLCREREVIGTKKTCRESQSMSEISSPKKNRERRNKVKVSQESLCSKSLFPIVTILNLVCKVEEWVNFKTMLAMNFTRLVHIGFFRNAVQVTK